LGTSTSSGNFADKSLVKNNINAPRAPHRPVLTPYPMMAKGGMTAVAVATPGRIVRPLMRDDKAGVPASPKRMRRKDPCKAHLAFETSDRR
jgi:hypothetical protein